MNAVIHIGDCVDVMAKMDEASVDTIITDPPYHLTQVSRGGSPRVPGSGPAGRHRVGERGFMGKTWDGGGISFEVATWMQALRVAKPGAFLVCFGGTRTWHRLACAIEDAGWEIRDTICYLFGSGFPKSHSISKAIDRAVGAKRKVVGKKPVGHGPLKTGHVDSSGGGMSIGTERSPEIEITIPATDEAKIWDGYGTCMKPAWETIILAMKPLDGTFADNAIKHGVSGLWIDGARINYQSEQDKAGATPQGRCTSKDLGAIGARPDAGQNLKRVDFERPEQKGRWPANVVLSHSPDCVLVGTQETEGYQINRFKDGAKPFGDGAGHEYTSEEVPGGEIEVWACTPGCPVRMLDDQTRRLGSGGSLSGKEPSQPILNVYSPRQRKPWQAHGDCGGASRFFYCSKANVGEREKGLIEHIPCSFCGGFDTTHHVNERGKKVKCRRNTHPTVKPLALMEWLCRLTRPPSGGVVLDPFMGSGTTGVACHTTGRDFIGIEQDEATVEVAKHRIGADSTLLMPVSVTIVREKKEEGS